MSDKKQVILIVEDEPHLLGVLKDTFATEGFEVIIAKDGADGYDKAIKKHPDIVLLDIVMPKMDGIAVLKKLQEDEWGKRVPVLMLSNLCDSKIVMETIQGGATDFLIKTDWRLDEVVVKVKNVLKKREK